MKKIVGSIFIFVTFILIASISLTINISNEQIVSAANIPAPSFPQDMLKQKSIQADPNEQMPEVAPPGMEMGLLKMRCLIPTKEQHSSLPIFHDTK